MKKVLFIMMLGLMFGQYLPDVSKMSETEKMLVFQNNKKSPTSAVIYSLFLSSSGHAYSGKWTRGLVFTLIEISSLVGYIHYDSYAWSARTYEDKPLNYKQAKGISDFFAGSFLVFTIWESVDAYKQVKKYNNNLYKNIFGKEPPSFSMNILPTYKGANLTLAYKFN